MWFWDIAGNVIGFIVIASLALGIAGLALMFLFWFLGKLRSVITQAIRPFDLPIFLAIAMMTVFLWKTIDAFSGWHPKNPEVHAAQYSEQDSGASGEAIWDWDAHGNLVRRRDANGNIVRVK